MENDNGLVMVRWYLVRLKSGEDKELYSQLALLGFGQRHKTYIVCRRNCNAVFEWMPAHVQDLLVEVDLIRIGLLLHATAGAGRAAGSRTSLLSVALAHRRRYTNLLCLECRLVCLEHNLRILFFLCGVDHEVVVVAAGHNVLGVAREDHLELVEDAIVLVRIAEARAQVLVDGDGLDWLAFHVDIPNLHCQVVPGHNVPPVVGESHVGDGGDNLGEEGTGRGILFLFELCIEIVSTCNWHNFLILTYAWHVRHTTPVVAYPQA